MVFAVPNCRELSADPGGSFCHPFELVVVLQPTLAPRPHGYGQLTSFLLHEMKETMMTEKSSRVSYGGRF